MSVFDLLRTLIVEKGMSPEDAAASISGRDDFAELVEPLLIACARRYRRSATREIEHEIAAGLVGPDTEGRLRARQQLAAEWFPVGATGRWVHWLDATAEDHRLRAQWQRTLAGRCVADAELHEEAARQIDDAGVSCLRDLGIEEVA